MTEDHKLIKDIVWEMCFSPGRVYCDDTKETHYDIMDMLLKKHKIKGTSFKSCLELYNLIGEVGLYLNQMGAYYPASGKIVEQLKNKYIKYTGLSE